MRELKKKKEKKRWGNSKTERLTDSQRSVKGNHMY